MSDIFHVIADATRRDILVALLAAKSQHDSENTGEMRVSDLVEALEISQPTVSKHLKVLREAEVVTVREDGAARFYSLLLEPFNEVEDFVLRFLSSGVEANISVEYVTSEPARAAAETATVLPEQVSHAASEVGRAAALAAKPVKELVARFRLKP